MCPLPPCPALAVVFFSERAVDSQTRLWSGQCLVLGYPPDLNLSLLLGHPVMMREGTCLGNPSKPGQRSELTWVGIQSHG